MKRSAVPPPKPAWWHEVSGWMLKQPRITRIVTAAGAAVLLTLLVVPLIDRVYLDNFFTQSTVIVPALLASAIGLVWYGVGWWLLVGMRGSMPVARPVTAGYLVVSAIIVLCVLLLMVGGAADLAQG